MLDILLIVHNLSDSVTASRIRQTCKKLSRLNPIPIKIMSNTMVKYIVGDKLHRQDGPAVTVFNGDRIWYLDGLTHREYFPAYVNRDVDKWYIRGKLHREYGPAICGSKSNCWWLRGDLHRHSGPSEDYICIHGFRNISWHVYGNLSRLDDVARSYCNIYSEWYIKGVQHRINGAATFFGGTGTGGWYINGNRIRCDSNS